MNEKILNECQNSKSLEILHKVFKDIPERHFHDHTFILYDIRTCLGDSEKIYTEIGSYVGHSACLLLKHEYKTILHCIDPLVLDSSHFSGKLTQEQTLKKNIENNNEHLYIVNIHKKYSTDAKFIDSLIAQNFKTDILFIDGDHTKEGVLNDFYKFHQFVNKGGFIIFDDYLDFEYSPQVNPTVNLIKDEIIKNKLPFEIIGCLPNIKNTNFKAKGNMLNEYILLKTG